MRYVLPLAIISLSLFGCGSDKPNESDIREAHNQFRQKNDKLHAFRISDLTSIDGYHTTKTEFVTYIQYRAEAMKDLSSMKHATDHLGRRLHTPHQLTSIQSTYGNFKKGDEFEVSSRLVLQRLPSSKWEIKSIHPESIHLIVLGL